MVMNKHWAIYLATSILLGGIGGYIGGIIEKKVNIPYSNIEVCDSIFRAEGGVKAGPDHYYGVMIPYKDIGEAQAICLKTVRHARVDYRKLGLFRPDFISFLGKRYCPGEDNATWTKNVKYFIAHKNDL
jgi:hypothetical protein